MSVHDLDDRRPKCCYCGDSEIHPDFTCPRVRSVTLYPDGTVEVALHEYGYDIEIELDDAVS
jgi:hypothetical protein